MSHKADEILEKLEEVLMRLDRIETLVDFTQLDGAPEDIDDAMEKLFGKGPRPKLSIVRTDPENNVIDLNRDEEF
tara:strand:+ start:162 stop:386 length:225 start_codon:yes stop_codon:yes gene_type:complete